MKISFSNVQECHRHLLFKQVLKVHLISIMWFASHAHAMPDHIPPDVFEATPGGYLYANYPGIFDDIDEGITIEAWVYLNEPPEDRARDLDRNGNWLIFGKPGSYFVNISGRNLADSLERDRPEGIAMIRFGIEKQSDPANADSWGYKSYGHGVLPESYQQRWIHIALQISAVKDGIHYMAFYDQRWPGGGSKPRTMGRMNSPLMIGGPNPKSAYGGWQRFESMRGYIDEVRVSKGMRYSRDRKIQAKRPLQVDARTIALWRFREAPGAHFYRDSSGNGYTLFPGGSLSVDTRGKLTTTWGSLKYHVNN